MHMNALKTRLTRKNVQTNPEKSKKIDTTLLLFYVDTINFFGSNKRQWISFRPQRWDVPYRNHQACESLWFVRSISPNLPHMGQYFYHSMLMPLHDSMPSFMNFRRVLDLLEFKNKVSQCLRPSDSGRVFDIPSHFLHGT